MRRRKMIIDATGIMVDVREKAGTVVPDQVSREHMWCILAMFRLKDPAAERFDMDMENLTTIQGPLCYFCEQQYEPGMENTPCIPVP